MGGCSVQGQEVLDFLALTNILNGESTINCMYTVRSSEIFMIFLFLNQSQVHEFVCKYSIN